MEPKTYLVIVKRTDGILAHKKVLALSVEAAALRAMSLGGVVNVIAVFLHNV